MTIPEFWGNLRPGLLLLFWQLIAGSAFARRPPRRQGDPGNAEARYEMASLLFGHDQITLEQYATEIRQSVELAASNGDTALGHYMLAQLASSANDYGLALIEVDKALALESTSVRYLRAKMLYLFEMARPDKNADLVAEGITVSEQALLQVTNDPKRYFTAGGMHFEIGRWLPVFRDEYLELANEHFRSAAASGEISELWRAYSWGNMSGNLLLLRRCQEAMEAAETALSIRKYGSAQGNLRKANKCLKRVEPPGLLCRYLNFCDWSIF